MNLQYLLPANEVWGKIIFLHLCVILFTGGKVCIGEVYIKGGVNIQGSLHWGGLHQGGVNIQGSLHWGGSASWGGWHPGWGVCQTPRSPKSDTMGYGKRTGGTHPTGMHSCLE